MRIKNLRRRRRRLKLPFWKKNKSKSKSWWLKLSLLVGSCGLVAVAAYSTFFLPSVKDAGELSFAESTIIYDRGALEPGAKPEDHILYVIHGDENRDYIPLKEISPWVAQATLAIEDDQFYYHFGFDFPALVKVFLHEAFGIGPKRGGSTITQQLAKQVFLSSERSYIRKFKELLIALKLEWYYSKDEILELYLNKIPYGNNAFGIEAAARTYFNKSARDLTITEASILASIPVAPTRFSPYGSNRDLLMGYYEYENFSTEAAARAAEQQAAASDPDQEDPNAGKLKVYKKGRKDLVLHRMLELNMITEQQFYQAWSEANTLEFERGLADIKAPHFVFYVREEVEAKYGNEFLSQGGLQIYTTLDPTLQTLAEDTIATKSLGYENLYGAENLAMTAINPENGEILAYVGGKNWFDTEADGQVDVLTSRRQPGSSFKPLVYAAGFMEGLTPGTIAFDVETDFGAGYTPQNFDGTFAGPVSLRQALNRSLNIPAVKVAAIAGPNKILQLADALGIQYEGDADTHGLAIGIGVAEVEPLSHIASFQAFTTDGNYHRPQAILEIRNAEGKILEQIDHESAKREGLDDQIAALVRHVLTDESTRPTTGEGDEAFDWNILLDLPEHDGGAKTGTSNRVIKNPEFNTDEPETEDNPKFITVPGDSWTIGFTPHLVSGVWVGNNRGKPMKPGATGLTVAAPVWKTFMDQAHETLKEAGADPEKPYPETTPLEAVEINRLTAQRATDDTPDHLRVTEYYAGYNLPTEFDTTTTAQQVINIFTGEIADANTPQFAIRTVPQLPLQSLKPEDPNWQQPVEDWLRTHPLFISSLGAIMDPSLSTTQANPTTEPSTQTDTWEIPSQWLAELSPELQRRWRQLQNQQRLTGESPDWRALQGRQNSQDRFTNPGPLGGDFSFRITSPQGTVSPGEVNVTVQAGHRTTLESVEYYWDEKLIYKAVKAPFTGRFSLPTDTRMGSAHTITAVATDVNFNTAQDDITVRVQADRKGPEVIFLGPLAEQKIAINSEIQLLAEVLDPQSGVAKVEFFLNGNSLGTSTKAPFTRSFKAPSNMGRHTLSLSAWDTQNNLTEKSIPITITREEVLDQTQPFILKAEKNFRTLSIQTAFPEPRSITAAQLVVSQAEQILYQADWAEIDKFKYIYLPLNNAQGSATIQLYVQYAGQTDFEKVDTQTVRL